MKMQGFFDAHFEAVEEQANCEKCGLYKHCESPKLKPIGKGKAGIMCICESPDTIEDSSNTLGIGETAKTLKRYLAEYDIDLQRDCVLYNALACSTHGEDATHSQLALCRMNLMKAIEEHKPKALFLFGAAVDSFFSTESIVRTLSISHLRGRAIPRHSHHYWVFPMLHPLSMIKYDRSGNDYTDKTMEQFFTSDLRKAIKTFEKPLPDISFLQRVKQLTLYDDTEGYLRKILNEKPTITIDYETNAVSPYRDDPRIRCIGLQDVQSKWAYVFPYQYQSDSVPKRITKLWRDILYDKNIKKVGQNIKFESHWGLQVLNVKTRGWIWDTMINTHILEGPTRGGLTGVNGLKEQAFLRWGIADYNEAITPYINKADATGQNNLHEAPLTTLLQYCGMDNQVTVKLFYAQQKEMDIFLSKGQKFLQSGLTALFDVESNGLNIDERYYEKEERRLTKKAQALEEQLLQSQEARKFKKLYKRTIKLGSSDDLRELFYNIMKMKPIKFTSSTQYNDEEDRTASVDKSVMLELDNEFAKNLVALRKVLKIKDTYLSQFKRYGYNGKLHPTYNLHIARTYRSSSSNPNSQNIPNREPEAEKSVRSGVIPSKGNFLQEVDYRTMEIRILACLTHDPVLMKYISSGKDMHLDEGVRIFGGTPELISGDMRFNVKGGWSFAQVYGSYYVSCARHIWEIIDKVKNKNGLTLKEHLDKYLGVKTLKQYTEHLHDAESVFWDKYRVTKQWQTSILKFYEKHLYVEMPFGFRRGGILSRNKITNTPVQGTAFHCLLWSLIQLVKHDLKGFKSSIRGQIHDSLIMDIYPPEEKEVNAIVKRVMCEDVREANPFIIVPLDIEIKKSKINGSWYMK